MAAPEQSKNLQLISKVGISLVIIALVLTIAGGWLASTRPVAAIDQPKLESYQKSLQSYAAEGLLLADQLKTHRSLANYTEVSFKKLFEATSDVVDQLEEEQYEANINQAVTSTDDQANNLADALAKLSKLPSGDQLDQQITTLTSVRQQLEKALETP